MQLANYFEWLQTANSGLRLIFIRVCRKLSVMRVPKTKPLDEILKMDKQQLLHYLKESEISIGPTDSIEVVPCEHGTKIQYYYKNQTKPYKTRVYLSKIEDTEFLK